MPDNLPKLQVTKDQEETPKEHDESHLWTHIEKLSFLNIILGVAHLCVGYSLPLVIIMVVTPIRIIQSELCQIHVLGFQSCGSLKRPFKNASSFLPPPPNDCSRDKFRAQQKGKRLVQLQGENGTRMVSAKSAAAKRRQVQSGSPQKNSATWDPAVLPQIEFVGPDFGFEPYKFLAGVYDDKSGLIICPPAKASRVLCYDPKQDTAEFIGPEMFMEGSKYSAAVLGKDGFVYCPPSGGLQVLRIDPMKRTTEFVGPDLGDGVTKYLAAVVGSDGRIYCPPASASQVLCIDVDNGTVELIGPDMGETRGKYAAAVLGLDGKIYCPPACARQTLCMDLAEGTMSFIGDDFGIEAWKYRAAIKTHDGIIYCPPASEAKTLCINPARGTTQVMATKMHTRGMKWVAGALGKDGVVYCPPYNASRSLLIDPSTNTVQEFGPEFALSNMYSAAIVTADDRVYCPPSHAGQFLLMTMNYDSSSAVKLAVPGLDYGKRAFSSPSLHIDTKTLSDASPVTPVTQPRMSHCRSVPNMDVMDVLESGSPCASPSPMNPSPWKVVPSFNVIRTFEM